MYVATRALVAGLEAAARSSHGLSTVVEQNSRPAAFVDDEARVLPEFPLAVRSRPVEERCRFTLLHTHKHTHSLSPSPRPYHLALHAQPLQSQSSCLTSAHSCLSVQFLRDGDANRADQQWRHARDEYSAPSRYIFAQTWNLRRVQSLLFSFRKFRRFTSLSTP